MIKRFKRITSTWLKLYMSLQGRVLIANSLLMSIPRFTVRFLEMPGSIRKALKKEYYRLIWDDKKAESI